MSKIVASSASSVAIRAAGPTGAAQPAQTGGGSTSANRDVVLVLNERELGRAVEAVLEKRHDLRID